MDHNPHILFVDDEENILLGLRRGLRRRRHDWDMSFAGSGAEALDIINTQKIDLIVSDMRMPQMDGAELLERVSRLSPDTARVVLSGYAKDEVVLKVIGPAHQYLAKPCDFHTLEDTITRIFDLRKCIGNEGIREIITGQKSLPTLPDIYSNLLAELENPHSTNQTIASIIEHDLGLKSQVLKICNSAFFGLPQKVATLDTAISMIGINTLRSMTLLNGIFTVLQSDNIDKKVLERLCNNSLEIATMAKKIAKSCGFDEQVCDLTMSAGTLSHIGTLLIAASWPDEFRKAGQMCEEKQDISIDRFEQELIGADHGHIGAYLLGLWGFPLVLCEAVAYHHRPSEIGERKHPVLTCLHLAQHLAKVLGQGNPDLAALEGGLDRAFLRQQGVMIAPDALGDLLQEFMKKGG